MNRAVVRLLFIGGIVLPAVAAGFVGCQPQGPGAENGPARTSGPADQLTVFITGTTAGNLEPCNCPGNPYGGLSRRQTLLRTLRGQYGTGVLLDTGNMVPATPDPVMGRYIIEGYGLLGYDAIAVGDGVLDLLPGPAEFAAQAHAAKLPLVLTNVSAKRANLGVPYRWISRDGRNVLVLAVVGRRAMALSPPEIVEQLAIDDPADAVRRAMAQAERDRSGRRADVVVVMACLESGEREAVVGQLKGVAGPSGRGIDLVVLSTDKDQPMRLEKLGGLPVIYAAALGRQIGTVVFSFRPPAGQPALPPPTTAEDNEIPTIQPNAGAGPPWIIRASGHYIELKLARDKVLWEHYQSYTYDAQQQTLGLLGKVGNVRLASPAECGDCHQVQYKYWMNHKHGHAWETIVHEGRSLDPACMRCHTTGYGLAGGFRTAKQTPQMAGVGCQDCHQVDAPTRAQVAAFRATPPTAMPTRPHNAVAHVETPLCQSCHTVATSPKFDPAVYRPMATCPKGAAVVQK